MKSDTQHQIETPEPEYLIREIKAKFTCTDPHVEATSRKSEIGLDALHKAVVEASGMFRNSLRNCVLTGSEPAAYVSFTLEYWHVEDTDGFQENISVGLGTCDLEDVNFAMSKMMDAVEQRFITSLNNQGLILH